MAWLILAACGGASAPTVAPSGPPAELTAAPIPGDFVVGEVTYEGTKLPIWASCVEHQVARGAKSARIAAEECGQFELLAREAAARGLATYSEVVDETRRALVARIVALDFERRFGSKDAFRGQLDDMIANPPPQLAAEVRVGAHALIKVEANAPADVVARRREVAEQIHAAAEHEPGLMAAHLRAIAEPIAKRAGEAANLDFLEALPYLVGSPRNLDPAWTEALAAIPEVGRVSPVTRIEYGWVVILLADRQPKASREQVEQIAFETLRATAFKQWTDGIAQARGMAVEKHPELLKGEP